MTPKNRLTKVYLIITAAQAMIHQGNPMSSVQLLQDARIIASVDDEFLKNNETQISNVIAMANKIIEDFQSTLKGEKQCELTENE